MKSFLVLISVLVFSINSFSQDIEGTELGIDGTFYATSGVYQSGTIGLGLKYGFVFGENLILGPSFRYQRSWTNNTLTGTSGGFNVYGGGVFIHGRFNNVLFIGMEGELLKSPYTTNGFLSTNPKWVGTCLLGGGFSREFDAGFRLNAGVYYDILDVPNPANPSNVNPNSPLQPYVAKKENGTIIPILYRISLFIPLS